MNFVGVRRGWTMVRDEPNPGCIDAKLLDTGLDHVFLQRLAIQFL